MIRVYLSLFALFAVIMIALASWVSHKNTIIPEGIVIHHSALPFQIATPSDVKFIEDIHRRRGFSAFYWGQNYAVGYHYIILPNGILVSGRPEKCRGAHTRGYNNYIGVCLIGNFEKNVGTVEETSYNNPTIRQLNTLRSITGQLMKRYSIPADRVLGHNSLDKNTECPGRGFPVEEFLNDLEIRDHFER
jgi:hypothetical protein